VIAIATAALNQEPTSKPRPRWRPTASWRFTVTEREFDVLVIGMGPGGEFAATKLAGAGVPVAAVEERLFGGECHFRGCVPSKMMIGAGIGRLS